ncbi:hypothetical protein NFI96_020932 [Prochilodus magdalenae]|nr:hypothetical protein NFI96_020932 [Prochilodus magdalenae]
MASTQQIKIGIIGGSGLDDPDILECRTENFVDTPFGKPSDALIKGKIKNVECVLLARHGRQHTIMPSNVNYRANIWALKEEGCTHVVATTACGSLREDIQPGDIVLLDQFIDRTTKRVQTFYDGSPSSPSGVCHIPMAEPFCSKTREVLLEVVKGLGIRYHPRGTMLSIEGPRFSSRAESHMFRQWGADLINMTTVPEVVLAKEAGLCYASIAMATDYDCWKEHEEAPLLLRDKLMKMEVDMHLVTWITDYLTGRPQHVRIRDCSSDTVISSTGAPQGTVLSPVLFTLYTSDFKYNSELCHMQKFSDDTAIVGCVRNGQEREYRSLVEDFVEWCTTNHLKLNITKTKEMCIDFRRSRPSQQPISIKGVDVEVVRSYRYLGVHLDERLDWSVNTDIVYKKAQSRLYFLRRLGSFRICQKLLLMFYQSVVASVLFYAVVCWGGSISKRDAGRLDRLVCVDNVLKTMKENANKASSILLTAIPLICQMDWEQTISGHRAMALSSVMLPKH